ncbi:hypothetical protein AZE42_10303 [Rhizopogon vesiculosus]|uniref:Uncharacterized protein n=1 Tax=Rhizopogon vesiculosus TaxID=180088 RepID=A0A1J8PJX6_9AGAM|nr:hypothetical protein AZE42_10303 [Rhizopogon vesiculosus]
MAALETLKECLAAARPLEVAKLVNDKAAKNERWEVSTKIGYILSEDLGKYGETAVYIPPLIICIIPDPVDNVNAAILLAHHALMAALETLKECLAVARPLEVAELVNDKAAKRFLGNMGKPQFSLPSSCRPRPK